MIKAVNKVLIVTIITLPISLSLSQGKTMKIKKSPKKQTTHDHEKKTMKKMRKKKQTTNAVR
jgi:hypothetical protein